MGPHFTASGRTCFYQESSGYGTRSFASLDPGGSGTDYEYVFLDAPGNAGDYYGLDVARKIVFVASGSLTTADKVNFAVAKGAAAVVICDRDDDVYGLDLTGVYYTNPVIAISRSDAQAIMAASTKVSGIAYTGTMTVCGRVGAGVSGSGNYTMSDFSSWGVPGSLTLKPRSPSPM